MEKPYISFVVTARNDDYGGNWQNRINAFMKVLAYQAERVRLPIELVFCEDNPVPNKPLMAEVLVVPKNEFFQTRFIIVPNEFHRALPDSNKVPVCEFIGKNIAARRSNGEYICGTNPDVLYSDELFDFFALRKLDPNHFYRVNRSDTSISKFADNTDVRDMLVNAKKSVTKIMYNDHSEYVSWKLWLSDFIHGRTLKLLIQCPLFNSLCGHDTENIHENAAGDFLLTHRDNWNIVGGYDERTVGSGVLDGYMMYTLFCKNLNQMIVPFELYHMYHHHGGVKYLASYEQFRKDAKTMLETKQSYKQTNIHWGFPLGSFREIIR
ncbi:MAG: hypothetical protein COV01_03525 [Candidatus Taylorbacteria bacterium CG10_big_fil_rev_8_21_14_0_10_41_48]|uniref:Glycosyltransferase 2-like domain-containing protein n=1 Tax=Candidatus Taylorbacteria bacterium CG10_big_fil_rev_8_21_14_0_10_41_48 TaxID=1975024 RepID=A0A2M8LBC0_9BACT|nr:MAG: hypothetical protein COV01_03525 [Candidatus Taylorbacteria bacterium CG10_big_fil_rev_8_21_14_0_10_41_48]